METFGKRYGFDKGDNQPQLTSMNHELRNDLYNAHTVFFTRPAEPFFPDAWDVIAERRQGFFVGLWSVFFHRKVNEFTWLKYKKVSEDLFYDGNWYKVYEYLEEILKLRNSGQDDFEFDTFIRIINDALSENNSAYQINNYVFIPINQPEELAELERLKQKTIQYKLKTISTHLETAKKHLAHKPDPDLRNSIKESISMVGTIARMITNDSTLGKALNTLDKKKKINSELKSGFEKLYAFTNSKEGIRHEFMDDSTLDLETTRFFLISCSAFTNYLIQKALNEGIIKDG